MNTQELPTEAQAYLRDAAQYIFDTYGNEALQRLTDDFDGCMKEFSTIIEWKSSRSCKRPKEWQ